MSLTYGSVCSGIEAATLAWKPLGWTPCFFSEIEKFPSQVLAHHYGSNLPDEPHSRNGVPNYGDMTKFQEWPDHAIDLLVGGTPCQSFSVAGLRKGLDDPRGNLMLTYLAIARRYQPRWLVWENVPGVLSSNGGRDFGTFIRGLEECGYHAAWRVLDAQYVRVDGFARAVPQRRRRVFVVGYLGDWRRAAAVLFEPEGMRGDNPPRRETGKGTSGAAAQGFGSSGDGYWREGVGPLRAREQDSHESLAVFAPEIARCVATREGSSQDYETTTMVAVSITGDVAHTLKAEGADASEDGTGRGTPIVCVHGTQDPCTSESTAFALGRNSGGENVIAFTAKDYGGDAQVNLSPTLRAGGHSGSHANAGVMPAVAIPLDMRQASRGATMTNNRKEGSSGGAPGTGIGEDGDPSPTVSTSHPPAVFTTLRASQGGGDKPHVSAFQSSQSGVRVDDVHATLDSNNGSRRHNGAFYGSAVRRLTPVECERLQGFPDDYTLIPVRKVSKANQAKALEAIRNGDDGFKLIDGEAWVMAADGPRYKALGNSMPVNVMRWIGSRIDDVERRFPKEL